MEDVNNDPNPRKTISKYLEKDNWNQDLPENLPETPSFPSLEPFKNTIHQWLIEDKRARRKQRHSAKRIYERLKEEFKDEFHLSYRTVAAYVAQEKASIIGKKLPAALPLEHIPGEAQVDFGDADFYENGKRHSGKYLEHVLSLQQPRLCAAVQRREPTVPL